VIQSLDQKEAAGDGVMAMLTRGFRDAVMSSILVFREEGMG
jgi:hypothetical protein